MNLYISAKWLEERVHDVTLANGALHGCVDKLDIYDAPSIDIVRCGECKHFIEYKGIRSSCVFHLCAVNADDFCSYGQRKESE